MQKIREATIGDTQSLRKLYLQLNLSDPIVTQQEFDNNLDLILASDWLKVYVLEINSVVIATCYLNIIPNLTRGLKSYSIIENVVTDIKYRNKGYGKSIVKHAISKAWEFNCYKVVLLTGSVKKSTLNFYVSCGLVLDGKTAFIARMEI